ncbi:MAG: NADH-quinone oxidoreductase subunit M, partial [Dehalococcoidia bacterium]|nr:NADH-quinone oxidoreductase subunit M [Dehalococcoidia bacterium]
MLVPRRREWTIRILATLAGLITLALSVWVFIGFDWTKAEFGTDDGYQFVEWYEWLPELGITVRLGIDGISAPMVLLTGLVIFTGAIISWNIADRNKEYYALLLVLVSGVFGVFIALDLFFLFFFYEIAVLPMYLLIAVWGSTRKEYAAMKLTIYLVAGSILVWVGMLAVFVESGAETFNLAALAQYEYPRTFQLIFLPMFFIGFGVLAGMWPFHTWSPDGHVAAPTAVSMLHAGVLMKLGAYGILRVGFGLLPEGTAFWAPFFIILGTINVVYGALSAMSQRDLKFVIGYSSVSHMGYVLLGVATLNQVGLTGAAVQMFTHGTITGLLFVLVGLTYDKT